MPLLVIHFFHPLIFKNIRPFSSFLQSFFMKALNSGTQSCWELLGCISFPLDGCFMTSTKLLDLMCKKLNLETVFGYFSFISFLTLHIGLIYLNTLRLNLFLILCPVSCMQAISNLSEIWLMLYCFQSASELIST